MPLSRHELSRHLEIKVGQMKIRKGFVSNSSTASFLCEMCDTCWDPDHAPFVVAGLCDECNKRYEICNMCGELLPIHAMYKTKELIRERGGIADGDFCEWRSWMTCTNCLTRHHELIEEWVKNKEHGEWVKIVSNPKYKMTDLDNKLAKAIIKHESFRPRDSCSGH